MCPHRSRQIGGCPRLVIERVGHTEIRDGVKGAREASSAERAWIAVVGASITRLLCSVGARAGALSS